jgi:glyoxylase-like metal-dependent hydrolase (beta-lactamase superfamily II)
VAPGTFNQQITAQQIDVSSPWNGSLEFYLTPWGFLKGAADNNATVNKGVISWSPKVKAPSGKNYVINGYLNKQNQVERVETWLGENIMGDMHIVATYTGWKDFGGVTAPAKIVQTRGGWPFFEVTVTSAKGNPPDVATLVPPPAPAAGRGGAAPAAGAAAGRGGAPPAPPALVVTSEKLGDGLYRLTTGPGSYDSVIVEFKDYIMMLEAGQSQARALAYVAETKKLIPNKPIRYVFNTHPHSDHTGGLPVLVAEGATIITQQNNVKFLEGALNTPRTLMAADDTLAKNPKKAKVEGVAEKKVYTDGTRTVEMYHIFPAPHSNGLMIAYMPKEKVLFQGDFSVNPGEPANDHVKALVPVLEKLNLDFNRYINVHTSAAPQTKADVWKAMGKQAN